MSERVISEMERDVRTAQMMLMKHELRIALIECHPFRFAAVASEYGCQVSWRTNEMEYCGIPIREVVPK